MVYLSGQLKIVCRGGDAVGIIAEIFSWIKRLFIKDNQPVIKIRADKSNIKITYIHKD